MKTRPHMMTLTALLVLAPITALAQAPDQAAPPPPPPPAVQQPEAPPAAPAPVEASPSAPTLDDRLAHVEGKLEGMAESNAATAATVDTLKKIKLSGYLQGRYEWHDDAGAGVDANNASLGTNRFLVRRGRLKAVYAGTMSEYMLQIDATPDGVTLKDAEATLVLDETLFPSPMPWELRLTMGQFKTPFGFEVLQSSGDREMPERSMVIRTLFPGERDRGVRLQFKMGAFRLATALINGNVFPAVATFGINSARVSDPIAGSIDQSSFKDLVGRVGADLGSLVFGGSFYYGHTIATTLGKAASGSTPAVPASYRRFSRLRLGADAQGYIDVPEVGGLVVRGEVIYSNEGSLDYAGVMADPCRDIKSLGWIATLVQNVGDHFAVVFRADSFDRNSDVKDQCAEATKVDAANDRLNTYGGGLLYYVSSNLKLSAIYEHLAEQGKFKKDNDILTLQMQARF